MKQFLWTSNFARHTSFPWNFTETKMKYRVCREKNRHFCKKLEDIESRQNFRYLGSQSHKTRNGRDHLPELGTRQHCRDYVTMFSGQKNGGLQPYLYIATFGMATPFRHRGLKICRIFSCPWRSITFSRCRWRDKCWQRSPCTVYRVVGELVTCWY